MEETSPMYTPMKKSKMTPNFALTKSKGSCMICYTSKKQRINLKCGHCIHRGCLLSKVTQNIINGKHIIECFEPDCKQEIEPWHFEQSLKLEFRNCFKCLKEIDSFQKIHKSKKLKWCFTCRKVFIEPKSITQNCPQCSKSVDELQSMFPLMKFFLSNSNTFNEESKKKKEMCRMWLDDCRKQLSNLIGCSKRKSNL